MATIDAEDLARRLQDEMQDYWVHVESTSPLEKYPAKQHAQLVAQKLGVESGLIYLPGAPSRLLEDSDQELPFRQRRYFYYLSGVDEPNCHLTYDIGQDLLTLFIPEFDARTVIWFGRGSSIAEAYEKYDVDKVVYSRDIQYSVLSWMKKHDGDVYILHPSQAVIPGHDASPRVNYTKFQKAADMARVIKDGHEIKLIRKANEISAEAHRNILTNIRNFKNETEVEARFLDTCISKGAKNQAYGIIAASGENASVLHYTKNDEPFDDRQAMVLDAGAEFQCYASDVTRTFPLSGNWPTEEAHNIYQLVDKMQTECIARMGPGVRFLDLHALAHTIAVDGLLKLGILHNGTQQEILTAGTSLAFFPHGLGHHVGLEVHDVLKLPWTAGAKTLDVNTGETYHDILDQGKYIGTDVELGHLMIKDFCKSPVDMSNGGLAEGMVVTVEPGIYFNRYGLSTLYLSSPVHSKYINKEILEKYLPVGGVRIEDDILITPKGHENLTTAPKGDYMLALIRNEDAEETPLQPHSTASNVPPRPAVSTDTAETKVRSRASEVKSQGSERSPPPPRKAFVECPSDRNVHFDLPSMGTKSPGAGIPKFPTQQSRTANASVSAETNHSDCSSSEAFALNAPAPFQPGTKTTLLNRESTGPFNRPVEIRPQLRSAYMPQRHTICEYLPQYIHQQAPTVDKPFRVEPEDWPRSRNAVLPPVPPKTPQVPPKPLAYRHSVADFHTPKDSTVHRIENNVSSESLPTSDIEKLRRKTSKLRPLQENKAHEHMTTVFQELQEQHVRRRRSEMLPRSVNAGGLDRNPFLQRRATLTPGPSYNNALYDLGARLQDHKPLIRRGEPAWSQSQRDHRNTPADQATPHTSNQRPWDDIVRGPSTSIRRAASFNSAALARGQRQPYSRQRGRDAAAEHTGNVNQRKASFPGHARQNPEPVRALARKANDLIGSFDSNNSTPKAGSRPANQRHFSDPMGPISENVDRSGNPERTADVSRHHVMCPCAACTA